MPLRRLFSLGTAAAALLALGAAAPTAHAQRPSGQTPPPPLAFRIGAPVADTAIVAVLEHGTRRDTLRAALLADQIAYVTAQNPGLSDDAVQLREVRRSAVEGYLLQRLVEAEARRTPGVTADTAAVMQQLNAYEAQVGGREAFAAALAEDGLTRDSLRALLTTQALQGALVARWADTAPAPSAADVAAHRLRLADRVTVRHIVWLYPQDGGDAAFDAARAEAQAVLDSLRGGADFATLAARHGQDGTAERGGLLDAFGRDAPMDEAFKDAAFALTAPGEVTAALVESQFGWHAIRLDARDRGELVPEADAREALRRERQPEIIRERLRALVAAEGVVVRVNPAVFDADLNAPLTGR